ncbi:MAG: hypothetical protein AABY18_01200 [Candidatus Thermoplasmatota archaeon]
MPREPLDSADPNGWTGFREARFRLSAPYFHHYAEKVLHFDPAIRQGIEDAVARMDEAACFHRGRGGEAKGIDPKQLNLHLRDRLQSVNPEWTFETTLEDGVMYDHGNHIGAAVGGFDISRYDVAENLMRLRNVCFGRRPRTDGEDHWRACLAARPHWARVAAEIDWDSYPRGEDHSLQAKRPTILGELQFGNWGLAYRDYLKVVAADREVDIDCFLYLVPTGNLERYLSSGIVTFTNATRYLKTVAPAVPVPIVVWGIDVDVGPWKRPLTQEAIAIMRTRVGRQASEEPEEGPE